MKGKWDSRLNFLIRDADSGLSQLVTDSLLSQIMAKNGTVSNYNDTTDSLEAISEALSSKFLLYHP